MFPNLRAEIARANWSLEKFGSVINRSSETAKKKLAGRIDFKRDEMFNVRRQLEDETGLSLSLEYLFEMPRR